VHQFGDCRPVLVSSEREPGMVVCRQALA
jgi:hypothetical protein